MYGCMGRVCKCVVCLDRVCIDGLCVWIGYILVSDKSGGAPTFSKECSRRRLDISRVNTSLGRCMCMRISVQRVEY